jgi:hypothetical protein
MLLVLRLFLMAGQMDQLVSVLPGKIAPQRDDAGREPLLDAAAGGSQFLADTLEQPHRSPAPLVIDRTA